MSWLWSLLTLNPLKPSEVWMQYASLNNGERIKTMEDACKMYI